MRLFSLLFAALIGGCIGTDFVDQPLAPAGSKAEIEPSSLSLNVDEEYPLDFMLVAVDGSELAATWTWSSRAADVAIVDNNGLVKAIAAGQTWIDGIANQMFADSVLVTVVADVNAIASITVEGDTTNLDVGETRQLTAVLRNINGDILSGTVDWSSLNPDVAAVDNSGLVTAKTDGVTSIVASAGSVSSVPFELTVGESVISRTGTFSGRNGYHAEGTAILTTSGNNSNLYFDADFQTQSGPGLYVYLTPNESNVAGGLSLGPILSTTGEQTYTLPGSADPDDYNYVIIYCQPFGVLFGVAPLQ